MKNLNKTLLILLAGFSLMGVGCSKNDSSVASSGTSPDAPTTSTTGSTSTSSTNSTTFVPVSLSEFNSYVATHPLNNPSNFKITVSLQATGTNSDRYGGTVQLSYTDTGYQYTGTFTAGTGQNISLSGLKDNDTYEADFNRWFTLNGKTVFTGFFQDNYGSIVLVIDNVVNQGDAQGGSVVSGSVYYKNFAQSYTQQSPYRKCWFIYTGPWNCRDTAIVNKTAVNPTDGGYRKLGTFTSLNKSQAFQ